MKFYYSAESTPLNFHNAFYKVISPIWIGLNVIYMLASLGNLVSDSPYYSSETLFWNMILCGLSIVFLGCITYGFSKKEEYAWYMVYAYLGLIILSTVIGAASSSNAAIAVGKIIGSSIISALIGTYYYKRKPLFIASALKELIDIKQAVEAVNETDSPKNELSAKDCATSVSIDTPTLAPTHAPVYRTSIPAVKEQAEIRFCRKCGTRLLDQSRFCHKCGERSHWD